MTTIAKLGSNGSKVSESPLVSVAIITRNHGQLLAEALESALAQKVDFSCEIVIGDDFSQTESLTIAEEYADRYPHVVRLLRQDRHCGVNANVARTLAACRGEFVALLEGDDAWSFSGKLSRQVDFLQQNSDVAGCFHDALINTEKAVRVKHANLPKSNARRYSEMNNYPRKFYPWDLLARNLVPTASLVYRNVDLTVELERYRDIELSLSWILELLIIRGSRFEYFDESWAVHNNHLKSLTKQRSLLEFTQSNLKILRRLASDRYYQHMKMQIQRCRARELAHLFDHQLDHESSFKLMGTIVRLMITNTSLTLREAASMSRRMLSRRFGDRG